MLKRNIESMIDRWLPAAAHLRSDPRRPTSTAAYPQQFAIDCICDFWIELHSSPDSRLHPQQVRAEVRRQRNFAASLDRRILRLHQQQNTSGSTRQSLNIQPNN